MLKLMLALVLAISVSSVLAKVDTSGLSEVQQAELALKAAKMKSQSSITVDGIVNSMSKVGSIGKETGIAVRESLLAVSEVANKFGETKVGTITIGLVVWRMLGADIVKLLLGLIVFPTSLLLFFKMFFERKVAIEYEYVPALFGLISKRKPTKFELVASSEEIKIVSTLILVAGTGILTITLASIG